MTGLILLPEPEKVAQRPPVHEWGAIGTDGDRACWWCLATVHPMVAHLHDEWHYLLWLKLTSEEADSGED